MVRMSMMAILMFFSGDFVSDVLYAPPRDLAALLSPDHVLTQAGVALDEDSLIAALSAKNAPPAEANLQQAVDDLLAEDAQVRHRAEERLLAAREHAVPFLAKAADSDDEAMRARALDLLTKMNEAMSRPAARRDEAYVKKLFAIRQIEKTKSRKALPALRTVAEGEDITLADAARQAVAAISGEEIAPPDTGKALREIAGRLPDNVGFVGVLDLSRNRTSRTLMEIATPLLRDPEKGRMLQAMGGADLEEMIDDMQEELGGGILEAISRLGNLRIDAVVMMTSDNLPDRTGYVGWIIRGLCDPERLRRALAAETRERDMYTVGEHVVYGDRRDFAACVLDKHTVAIVVGPSRYQNVAMRMLLTNLGRTEARPVPPRLRKAFDTVVNEGHALAVSGALSDLQKAMLVVELEEGIERAMERQERNPRPERNIEIAGARMLMDLQGVEAFTGVVDEKGTLTLQAECESPKSAATLDASLANLHKAIQTMIAQAAAEMPAETKAMLGLDKPDAAFWLSTLADRTLTVTADIGAFAQRFGSMVLGERVETRRARVVREEDARRRAAVENLEQLRIPPEEAKRRAAEVEAARREWEARAAAEAARREALEARAALRAAEEEARAAAREAEQKARQEAAARRAAEEERRRQTLPQ